MSGPLGGTHSRPSTSNRPHQRTVGMQMPRAKRYVFVSCSELRAIAPDSRTQGIRTVHRCISGDRAALLVVIREEENRMTTIGAHNEKSLSDVINHSFPLGPPMTEAFISTSRSVFEQLYDATNHIHHATRTKNPSYIVGRKGSGKTAFLIGAALAENADVVPIQSEDIFTQVEKLRVRYSAVNGALVADQLVHAWEVLLFHAAMWAIACSEQLPGGPARRQVFTYMSAFGDPETLEPDSLLARVSALMTQSLLDASDGLSFREACWAIDPGRGSFVEAAAAARLVLDDAGADAIYVVVDNLEDLHRRLDDFEDIITALFRVTSRSLTSSRRRSLPFKTRFAFPAELLPRLRRMSANAEKDFLDHLIVRWTASELIFVAGNRLRTFLDLHYPHAPRALRLPSRHDHRDRDAAERTLRAILPSGDMANGTGAMEDPVAYIMRHTQLLPRHVIQILNEIVKRPLPDLPPDGVPRVTATDIIEGVRAAQLTIVDGILTTYSYHHPRVAEALAAIKNHAAPVESISDLHRSFNRASVARVGIDFEGFLDACLSIGALGIVTRDVPADRYVVGEFAYTYASELRPVEDRDKVCVHPLFMHRWVDRRVSARGGDDARLVYPYGSDPSHDEHEV